MAMMDLVSMQVLLFLLSTLQPSALVNASNRLIAGGSSPAIVRRLYHQHHHHQDNRTSHHSSQANYGRGLAKVTPISIQSPSFDSTIRLKQSPMSTDWQSNVSILQKPSSSLIKVMEIGTDKKNSSTLKLQSTSSSRQGKSISSERTVSLSSSTSERPSVDKQNQHLCFLSHGGSSETFTVNEAMPVHSVIGSIKVIGDVTDNGNIELSIIGEQSMSDSITNQNNQSNLSTQQQLTVPIKIEPGTKNLVLVRKLDKESVEGESSVTIGVRCRTRQQSSHSKFGRQLNDKGDSYWLYESDDIIIPIRILVTDANDNKPEWQGQLPYSANVSEMATIGSVLLQGIRAVDNDQLGPYSTVEYYVEPGPYSHLVRFISPLEGTLILAGQLDYESLPKFWVTIRAQDQGNPPNSATAKVNIQVQDADDQNPRFQVDKYTAVLSGDGHSVGQALNVQPKPIVAEDPDRGIQSTILYEFNTKDPESRENMYFSIDKWTGQVSLRRPLHSSMVSLPITLVIRAQQMDNPDRYALTTLTILNKRDQTMPELRFLFQNYTASILESTPPGQIILTVQTTSTSNQQPLRFQTLDDDEQYFHINNNGQVVLSKMVDYEKHHEYSFRVMVTDGRQTDLSRLTIRIMNVNEHDPLFSQSSYVFHVNEARLRSTSIIGRLQATDGDDGDRIQLSLSGPHAAAFALSVDGTLRVRSLRMLNTSECHMIATATDTGQPPRSSSASVVVKLAPALLKSLTSGHGHSRGTLESLLLDLEQQALENDLHGASISPTAVDILQHSTSNLFSATTNSTALVLVIVLGVLLGTLFIIIVALTLHVLNNRKYQSAPGRVNSGGHHPSSPVRFHSNGAMIGSCSSSSTSSSSSASSSSSSGDDRVTATGALDDNERIGSSSEQSVTKNKQRLFSARPVSLLNNNNNNNNRIEPFESSCTSSSLNQQGANSSNWQPAEQTVDSAISSDMSCSFNNGSNNNQTTTPTATTNSDSDCDLTASKDNGGVSTVASRISVIRWPQGSIPRRVKKLTWKDEHQRNNHLDQLYTANTTIVQHATAAKTKTFSGHLLTGLKCDSNSKMDHGQASIAHQNSHLTQAHHQYHHSAIRHHQTPHYPVSTTNTNPTIQQTLPDLTVYF